MAGCGAGDDLLPVPLVVAARLLPNRLGVLRLPTPIARLVPALRRAEPHPPIRRDERPPTRLVFAPLRRPVQLAQPCLPLSHLRRLLTQPRIPLRDLRVRQPARLQPTTLVVRVHPVRVRVPPAPALGRMTVTAPGRLAPQRRRSFGRRGQRTRVPGTEPEASVTGLQRMQQRDGPRGGGYTVEPPRIVRDHGQKLASERSTTSPASITKTAPSAHGCGKTNVQS